jgi:hypothetical protein
VALGTGTGEAAPVVAGGAVVDWIVGDGSGVGAWFAPGSADGAVDAVAVGGAEVCVPPEPDDEPPRLPVAGPALDGPLAGEPR